MGYNCLINDYEGDDDDDDVDDIDDDDLGDFDVDEKGESRNLLEGNLEYYGNCL